jgi:2-polyprenyl-3-methyl-5-hydroxy-6-metoxy-1,4-benzoquinol methylase
MTESYRDKVYGEYVSAHMSRVRDYSPRGYETAALFCRRRFKRWLPPDKGAAILELGCGHGHFLYWLRQEGYENLLGVDISGEQLELARRIHPNVVEADLVGFLKNRQQLYDVIVALDVIEHFRKEEALELARLVAAALRPGGRFLLQTLNADSPFEGHHRYGDLTHETAFNPKSLETLLRLAGFRRVEFAALGPVVHGPVSAVRWVLWNLIVLGLAGYQLVEAGTAGSWIFTQCMAACAQK